MTKAARYTLVAVALIVLLAVAVGGSYGLSEWAVARAQHQWCQTLDLLTAVPVTSPGNPGANPSRVEAYRLYTDFVELKNRFACGS